MVTRGGTLCWIFVFWCVLQNSSSEDTDLREIRKVIAETVFMTCVVDKPTDQVLWKKDGSPIVVGQSILTGHARLELVQDYSLDRNLRINNIKIDDEGRYICAELADTPRTIAAYNLIIENKQNRLIRTEVQEDSTTAKYVTTTEFLTTIQPEVNSTSSLTDTPTSMAPSNRGGTDRNKESDQTNGQRSLAHSLILVLVMISANCFWW